MGILRFRRLLDDAGEAIFITDRATGEIVDLNETACRWLRRTRASLIGQRTSDLDLDSDSALDALSDMIIRCFFPGEAVA